MKVKSLISAGILLAISNSAMATSIKSGYVATDSALTDLFKRGQYESVITRLQTEPAEDVTSQALNSINLCAAYTKLGRRKEANSTCTQSLTQVTNTATRIARADKALALAYNNFAVAKIQDNDYATAIVLLSKSLKLNRLAIAEANYQLALDKLAAQSLPVVDRDIYSD